MAAGREEDHSIVGWAREVRRVVLMSTTGASADPLAALASLPGVADSVESVRKAVDRVYGHRVMRRRSNEITSDFCSCKPRKCRICKLSYA